MKSFENVDLAKCTSVKIGGIAKKMLVPESTKELEDVTKNNFTQYFIGGGSNLLINNRQFDLIVSLREFNKEIKNWGEGKFCVGASVHLQKLIKVINAEGYGGIEYLYSVPGLVGGAVAMNAGRGKKYNKCISDYIVKVTMMKNGELFELDKEECVFSYRNSIFKERTECIIVSVDFLFPKQMQEESYRLRKERIEFCEKSQDNSAPNLGTIFMESDKYIMKLVKCFGLGSNGVHFSKKTTNWILNLNNGTYADATKAIHKVEYLHHLAGKKCKTEIIRWE